MRSLAATQALRSCAGIFDGDGDGGGELMLFVRPSVLPKHKYYVIYIASRCVGAFARRSRVSAS